MLKQFKEEGTELGSLSWIHPNVFILDNRVQATLSFEELTCGDSRYK